MEETPDVWKLAAITSFSVLAVVLVGAALIIGVMVHRRKSHKRPLRGEILSASRLFTGAADMFSTRECTASRPRSQIMAAAEKECSMFPK